MYGISKIENLIVECSGRLMRRMQQQDGSTEQMSYILKYATNNCCKHKAMHTE